MIRVIYNSAGEQVVRQSEIKEAHHHFYRKLYSRDPIDLQV